MEEEQWKDIPDFEGLYQASSFGRIRCLDRVINCKNGKTLSCRGRVMQPVIDHQGYQRIGLSKQCKHYSFKIHKLIMLAFVGERDNPKIQVNHIDCDKANNNLFNLEYCTRSHNIRHAFSNGLHASRPTGESHHQAKLKNAEVQAIREKRSLGKMIKELALEYMVSESAINRILSGRTYKNV